MKRLFAVLLVLASLTILVCVCQATGQGTVLDTKGYKTALSQPSDGTIETTWMQNKQLEYQISEPFIFPLADVSNVGLYAYTINSMDELTNLYGDPIPLIKDGIDEQFFEEHSMVLIYAVCGHLQFGMVPGMLSLDSKGEYHLQIDGYNPEVVSPVKSPHQLLIITGSKLKAGMGIVIDYTDHVVTHDEFYKMFPKS